MGEKGGKFWWFFTVNNFDRNDPEKIMTCPYFDKYVFQHEVGKSGTDHLQCAVKFIKPVKDGLKWLKHMQIKHLANVQYGGSTWRTQVNYCCKAESRVAGPWVKGWVIPEPLKLINPIFSWEIQILEMIADDPDDRSIYWVWDAVGKQGKTQFAKYLCAKHNGLFVSGKSADMKYAVAQWCAKHNGNGPKIIVINVPRSHMDYISYEGIESVKDGIFFSGKYESEMCIYNSPWIFVFANELPNFDQMSMDRWQVGEVKDSKTEIEWVN